TPSTLVHNSTPVQATACEGGHEASNESREAPVERRRASGRWGEGGDLFPHPPHLVAELAQLAFELPRCPRNQSGLRGLDPLDAHAFRHFPRVYKENPPR